MQQPLMTRKTYGQEPEAAMLKDVEPPEILKDYDEQGEAPVIEEKAGPDGEIIVVGPAEGVPVGPVSETPNIAPKTVVVPDEDAAQSEDAQGPVVLIMKKPEEDKGTQRFEGLEGLLDALIEEDSDDQEDGPGAPLECPGCGCSSKMQDTALKVADSIACPECGTKVATSTIIKTAGVYKVAGKKVRICIASRIRKMAAALEGRAPLSGVNLHEINKTYATLDNLAGAKPPYIRSKVNDLKNLISGMVKNIMTPSEEMEMKLKLHNLAQSIDPKMTDVVDNLLIAAKERNQELSTKREPGVKRKPF